LVLPDTLWISPHPCLPDVLPNSRVSYIIILRYSLSVTRVDWILPKTPLQQIRSGIADGCRTQVFLWRTYPVRVSVRDF